jgi:Fic family protein
MDQALTLHCSVDSGALNFLRDRLYVVRTLVPPGYEAYFRKRAQYRSVQTSTAIEGNQLGEEQAMLVLVEDAPAATPEELEVKNLDEAYDLIQQIATDPSVRIDEGLVRTMNSIMLRGLPDASARARGKYRVGPSLIVNSQTRAIRYRPPPPEWVPNLMENFVKEVQGWMDEKEYAGPVVAALAHFGLISIHPFEDGNGRTARLLADMILQKTGWSNEGTLSVSEAILSQQQEYYDVLYSTQGENFRLDVDATQFVQFHNRALSTAAANLESTVINFDRRRQAFVEHAKELLNPRQVLAFMFMMDVAPLSSSAYAELTGSSQSAALSDLTDLLRDDIVQRIGQGRNTRYRVNPDLRQRLDEKDAASVAASAEEAVEIAER